MLNFQWRLNALDPAASEGLRVISVFDALTEAHAGVEAILRSAAALSAALVGLADTATGQTTTASASGDIARTREAIDAEALPSQVPVGSDRVVFLTRPGGTTGPNDQLVLERLALCLSHALERVATATPRPPLEVLLDESSGASAVSDAMNRLRLDPGEHHRIVATPFAASTPPSSPRAVVFTTAGMLLAELAQHAHTHTRAGVGVAAAPAQLTLSWRTAHIALRLTTATRPILRADELGPILLLDVADESAYPHDPFGSAVARHAWAIETAEALCDTHSVRDAARTLGIHHSTMQARIHALEESLGYNPTRGEGATKLAISFRRHLLRTQHF